MFHSYPFREHQSPREYVEWAFADQRGAECRFGAPIVAGDRAAVEWWATLTSGDGSIETLAGVSLLRFDGEGMVSEQRDVWASEPGGNPLPVWALQSTV